MDKTLPLHSCQVQKLSLIINRLHTFLHFVALLFLFHYRVSFISQTLRTKHTPILPHVLVFASELILSFIWLLNQAYRWRPVSRKVFPERLPEDKQLPAIDVFICTADPNKEPTLGVMNTLISAMALDYPADKLNVYLSDDGGSKVTLKAMKEAWRFARWWLPFCKRFGVKTRCPEAYFSATEEQDDGNYGDFLTSEFVAEKNIVQEKYEEFTGSVIRIRENEIPILNIDHPSVVEVIHDKSLDQIVMPLLVYVSREKRPAYPHHFKAGALNVLLRVSSMINNSAYILGLDCDMYCNDPISARQAMCFLLDPKISPSLSHVQFPQKFHNISETDIYDSQLRDVFKVRWPGMDGLKGPTISGTCYYIKRETFYKRSMQDDINDIDLKELKHIFGTSNEFIKSLHRKYNPSITDDGKFTNVLLEESKLLASCAYETNTKWGKEVGFRYFSVIEDYFTGFNLHCKGWRSVYLDPPRPAFLGAGTTNLDDVLVQGTRWTAGLVEVAISKFNPLIYGSLRMSILEAMCYAELALYPFYFFSLWCLATIPQVCLLNDISLYPEVSSSFFVVFSLIFVSSQFKHIQEIFFTGGSFQTWRNEQRMWMIKSITCYFYGSLNAIMEKIGMREASFLPTNKVVDDEQLKRYQIGKFDFQASTMLLAPLCTLVTLNLASLVGGVVKAILTKSCNEMFIQIFLSFFVATLSYPIIEGMILRKDMGRIPPSVTRLCIVLTILLLTSGKFIVN